MIKLLIIRHAQSEGNKNKIIQGRTKSYGLSQYGIESAEKYAKENAVEFSNCDYCLSSPAKRCLDTIKHINKSLDFQMPVVITNMLEEMNPGILGDLSHNEASKKHPFEYKVWLARGDLDEIPMAESGNQLQARALAFITICTTSYQSKTLLVSTHAGFMRCLVNTICNNQRNTPVNISNIRINQQNIPDDFLTSKRIYKGANSSVYKFELPDNCYALKLANGFLSDSTISREIQLSEAGIIPPLYYISNIDLENKYCIVSKFMPNKMEHGSLDNEAILQMADLVVKSRNIIGANDTAAYTLSDKIYDYIKLSKDEDVETINEIINRYYTFKDDEVCLYDLHRDNFVKDSSKTYLIDAEHTIISSSTFSCACFIASSLIIENQEFDFNNIISRFDINKEKTNDIQLEIFIRLFWGILHFVKHGNYHNTVFQRYCISIKNQIDYLYTTNIINNNDYKILHQSIEKIKLKYENYIN